MGFCYLASAKTNVTCSIVCFDVIIWINWLSLAAYRNYQLKMSNINWNAFECPSSSSCELRLIRFYLLTKHFFPCQILRINSVTTALAGQTPQTHYDKKMVFRKCLIWLARNPLHLYFGGRLGPFTIVQFIYVRANYFTSINTYMNAKDERKWRVEVTRRQNYASEKKPHFLSTATPNILMVDKGYTQAI